jgi:hypothetical protein
VTVKTRPGKAHRSMSVVPTRAVVRRGVLGIVALVIGAVSVPGAGAATTHGAAPPDTGHLCKPGYLWLDIGER